MPAKHITPQQPLVEVTKTYSNIGKSTSKVGTNRMDMLVMPII